nr:M20/M25/M40 family metallo-hydrolase [Robiginitalea sp. SC105]
MQLPVRLKSGLGLLLGAACALLLSSCGAGRTGGVSKPSGDTHPVGGNKASAAPVVFADSLLLLGSLNLLASDALKGRDTGSEGLEKAADFLQTRLEAFGIQPYFETYRDTLSNTRETAFNIVGYLPGSDPGLSGEMVVLGAHYDHIGIVNMKNGDAIANGANDNASGTATLLEIARYFSQVRPPARSLVFAFFSAEERGLLGSAHLARKLRERDTRLYAMLNFEMTGVPMQGKTYLTYLTGYEKSNLAALCNQFGGEGLVGFLPAAGEYNLFQRSDNYSFYREFQVPAHTFSTFDFNNYPYYHDVADEASEMDYGHMARVVDRLIPAVRGVADSPAGTLKLN